MLEKLRPIVEPEVEGRGQGHDDAENRENYA
jgi:hypothetical protein